MHGKAYSFTQQSGDHHAACIELGNALQVEFGELVEPDDEVPQLSLPHHCGAQVPVEHADRATRV